MKKYISILLTLTILFSLSSEAFAIDTSKVDVTLEGVGNYLYETVKEPAVGSVGGEWAVMGLARSDMDIPNEYFENYYQTVTKYVKDSGGVLDNKKYTEYSRVIVALTSIGKNPADVAGYNLLIPLGDYEKTVWQGINGAIWALIALDSGNYDMPGNPNAKVQATREMYINHILEKQTSDGGWALSGDVADPDVTGMALQALSKYQDNDKVKSATEKALNCLSKHHRGYRRQGKALCLQAGEVSTYNIIRKQPNIYNYEIQPYLIETLRRKLGRRAETGHQHRASQRLCPPDQGNCRNGGADRHCHRWRQHLPWPYRSRQGL